MTWTHADEAWLGWIQTHVASPKTVWPEGFLAAREAFVDIIESAEERGRIAAAEGSQTLLPWEPTRDDDSD